MPKTTCLICEKEFETKRECNPKLTCSRECHIQRRRKIWKEQHPWDKKILQCGHCGKEFTASKFVAYKAKYCSVRCKDKAKSRVYYHRHRDKEIARTTEWRIHRKWQGNWYAALRRDEFKCQLCGTDQNILVHHKDGEGEKGTRNHSLDNLKSMCIVCHRKMHNILLIEKDGEFFVAGSVFKFYPNLTTLKVLV